MNTRFLFFAVAVSCLPAFGSSVSVVTTVGSDVCAQTGTSVNCASGNDSTGPFASATFSFGLSQPSDQQYVPGAYSLQANMVAAEPLMTGPSVPFAEIQFQGSLDLPSSWGNLLITGSDLFGDSDPSVAVVAPFCGFFGIISSVDGCILQHTPGTPVILNPNDMFATEADEQATWQFDFVFQPVQTPEPFSLWLVAAGLVSIIAFRLVRLRRE